MMSLELLDPTGQTPETGYTAAARLPSLDGLRIGLLSNGKVNADRLLRLTAERFVERHGCSIVCETAKPNASRIADPQVLRDLSHDVDFLITAVGD